jgi:hypothetical protein
MDAVTRLAPAAQWNGTRVPHLNRYLPLPPALCASRTVGGTNVCLPHGGWHECVPPARWVALIRPDRQVALIGPDRQVALIGPDRHWSRKIKYFCRSRRGNGWCRGVGLSLRVLAKALKIRTVTVR